MENRSRTNSIGGGVSLNGLTDNNGNRSRVTTPIIEGRSSWGPMPRGETLAGFSSPGNLRAGASAFLPRSNTPTTGSRLRFLSLNSSAEDGPTIVSSVPVIKKNGQQPAIGTKSSSASTSPVHAKAWFTTDVDPNKPPMGGRFMLVQGVQDNDLNTGIIAMIQEQYTEDIKGKKVLKQSDDAVHYDVVFYINDVRVASTIHDILEGEAMLTVSFVSHDWYSGTSGKRMHGPDVTTMYVAQVSFFAEFKGRTTDFDFSINVHDKIRDIAASYGVVLAFEQNKSVQYPALQFRVEYFKVSDAERVLGVANNGIKFEDLPGWIITTKQYALPTGSPAGRINKTKPTPLTLVKGVEVPPKGAEIIMSPTGRTAWYTGADGVDHPVAPPRPVANVNRENNPPSGFMSKQDARYAHPHSGPPAAERIGFGNHASANTDTYVAQGNEVAIYRGHDELLDKKSGSDIVPARIFSGLDVRTTVMMRNIPVTWGWQQLKDAIDVACAGRFNFMYLRIDFKRAENVGYAFVNFECAIDIVAFIQCWLGKSWEPPTHEYAQPKLAQISYATIQGLDQLIEKFRNSSIMDELADYRPMLFQTASEKVKEEAEVAHLKSRGLPTARVCEIGEKKNFPGWNNRAKKERSTANAGSIGLFAPKFKHFQGDRRYRSNWDRGTPSEMMDNWQSPFAGPSMAYGVPPSPFIRGPRSPAFSAFTGPGSPFAGPMSPGLGPSSPGFPSAGFGGTPPSPFVGAHPVMVPPHVANYNFGSVPRYQAVYPPNMGSPVPQQGSFGFMGAPFSPGFPSPQLMNNREGRGSTNGAGHKDSIDADTKMADTDRH